jgi:endonuclease/exonuclease/phosphatase family metal-dependent hydrolase
LPVDHVRYHEFPRATIGDIARLRLRLDDPDTGVPPKRTDHNVIIATWNLFHFGGLHRSYDENPRSPKRNLRALASIAEVIRRFDVVAIQEVKRLTTALRVLVEDFLGPDWSLLLSDVTEGERNNYERLAYVFDTRRVTPSGLVGEIVLPPTPEGDPAMQFARSPYVVGFRAGPGRRAERFALLTAHIRYGATPADRLPELQALATYTAREIRDRSRYEGAEEVNLILLGDFNIDRRHADDPLFAAFISEGLWVPEALRDFATTTGRQAKHYDQIAWFRDDFHLVGGTRAGILDFVGACYPELQRSQLPSRISDHFPMWVEFLTDRSTEVMARTLGTDPSSPDPLADAR